MLASTDLQFATFSDPQQAINPHQVEVSGWNLLPTEAERRDFVRTVSDHCALFAQVL
jgi:hypothetical protein